MDKDEKLVREWLFQTLSENGPLSFSDLWYTADQDPEFRKIRGWGDQYLLEIVWLMVGERKDDLHLTMDRKFAIGPAFLFD